jgi:hypothetical protein
MKRFAQCAALLAVAVMCLGVEGSATTAASPTKAKTRSAKTTKVLHKKAEPKPAHPRSVALAAPEDMTGTIQEVGPSDKILTLLGANGVPYDFRMDRSTRIRIQNKGDQKVTPSELAQDAHDHASIHFVPMAKGNVARTIEIRAS